MKSINQNKDIVEDMKMCSARHGHKIYDIEGIFFIDTAFSDEKIRHYHTRYYDKKQRRHKVLSVKTLCDLESNPNIQKMLKYLLRKRLEGEYKIYSRDGKLHLL